VDGAEAFVDTRSSMQAGRQVQKLNIMLGHEPKGRGARMLARKNAETLPQFANLAALPHWVLLDPAGQRTVALTVAALHYRTHIDHEINGAKLGAIANEMGEALFDKVCLAAIPGDDSRAQNDGLLPRPEQMEDHGLTIMTKALPSEMESQWPGAQGANEWRPLIDSAYELAMSVTASDEDASL
jgi:hypothetical protein